MTDRSPYPILPPAILGPAIRSSQISKEIIANMQPERVPRPGAHAMISWRRNGLQ
ncbi:hypothetical protein GGD66_001579 [Bradyrhizobium sp. CIR48]|uniref:hypothetical protein n=1 Tax=Bradyrhizobium sp. CIR48 TaxID=2663840 RepID=UPI0016064D75|nr:hypothetical protein [Bradyrhizobium sp. CIR48]MBB4423039.1 hypothetical protein [Bradyrhizobium sp. CIR48]